MKRRLRVTKRWIDQGNQDQRRAQPDTILSTLRHIGRSGVECSKPHFNSFWIIKITNTWNWLLLAKIEVLRYYSQLSSVYNVVHVHLRSTPYQLYNRVKECSTIRVEWRSKLPLYSYTRPISDHESLEPKESPHPWQNKILMRQGQGWNVISAFVVIKHAATSNFQKKHGQASDAVTMLCTPDYRINILPFHVCP